MSVHKIIAWVVKNLRHAMFLIAKTRYVATAIYVDVDATNVSRTSVRIALRIVILVDRVCVMNVTRLSKHVRIVMYTLLISVMPAFQVGSRRAKVVRKHFVVSIIMNMMILFVNYVNVSNVRRGSVHLVLQTMHVTVTIVNLGCVIDASTFYKNVLMVALVCYDIMMMCHKCALDSANALRIVRAKNVKEHFVVVKNCKQRLCRDCRTFRRCDNLVP